MLPLVPSYVGFLTGMTLGELEGRPAVALLHALLFVVGFSLVFILLGASATALGRALNYYQVWLQRIGGVLIIAFGLVCLGVFKPAWLVQERRLHLEQKPVGFLGSALVGMAFGAGWTPCIGPVLGAILGLAATSPIYPVGCCSSPCTPPGSPSVPPCGARGGALPRLVPAIRKYLPWVMRVSGALLVVVGVLLLTGEFTRMAGWLQTLTPEALEGAIVRR